MEDEHKGRRPQWKTTAMEDELNGRQPQWKTTSIEDNLIGRRHWKMTLACLVSHLCTQLGPAQPQLVIIICTTPWIINISLISVLQSMLLQAFQNFMFQDLQYAMRRAGQNPTDVEVQDLINKIDDGSGTLDFSDFCLVIKEKTKELESETHFKDTFRVFSKDEESRDILKENMTI